MSGSALTMLRLARERSELLETENAKLGRRVKELEARLAEIKATLDDLARDWLPAESALAKIEAIAKQEKNDG